MADQGQVVRCAKCQHSSPFGSLRCGKCNALLSAPDETPTGVVGGTWNADFSGGGVQQNIEAGSVLGGRYEILQLLGEGGMGAVYKARDLELDRLIAVKVIRPELAGNSKILQRFKQEMILARQVTHKNVIRIYDLGVSNGVKYITMEYVEGHDLSHLLQERKFSPRESLHIIRQVARALDSAHAENVIHRDLKPQNIMVGEGDRVSVMDFGLARSLESSGLTQTAAIMGTPAYMSPEQAQGQPLNGRSDIFSLGIIFYEMLTDVVPFSADSMLASLLRRTQGPPPSPTELRSTVPQAYSDVVLKCLAIKEADRYQTAQELLKHLEILHGESMMDSLLSTSSMRPLPVPAQAAAPACPAAAPEVAAPEPVSPPQGRSRLILAGIGVAAVLAAGVAFFAFRGGSAPKRPATAGPVTVVVADFKNTTGDAVYDGTLESMITLALEGAPFISTLRHDQAVRVAKQLKPETTALTEPLARLVAVREGVNVVVSGSIRRTGSYEMSVQATDAATGKELAKASATAANKEAVLSTIGKLAAPIRKALGDVTPESAQMAAAETFTSASLDAAHSYSQAQDLRFAGKGEEAVRLYLHAVEQDPSFGSAYAGLAAIYANLGQREESLRYYKLAMERIDHMTDREKYRTRGGYYLATMDAGKAIDEFSALAARYPADTMGLSSLAFAYYLRRDMPKALEEGRRALAIYPKNVPYRNNVALYALYGSEFETARKESAAALQQNPAYLKAYVTQALANLAAGDPATCAQTYQKMQGVSALGASFASAGMADFALFESRPADAVAILEKGVADDLANKNQTAAAKKLTVMGEALLMQGRKAQAIAAVDRAVGLAKESVLFPAARLYVEAGVEAKATPLASDLNAHFEPLLRAYGKIISGLIDLRRGKAREAIAQLQESQQLADSWIGRFDLGRAYLQAEAYAQADTQFEQCMRRRGEATDVYLDEAPTYRYFPPVYYYVGRVREGMKSDAKEPLHSFLNLKAPNAIDPLVDDARRRVGGK